ncbi:MAG: hypothetical protein JWQ67_1280 [Marmoricola sp.]|nr:hypothetical protein [Marmoricola sp.]
MSGSRITRLAVLGGLLVLALDLAVFGRLTLVFDIGFVLICLGAALAVHPRDFLRVAALPPLLLLGFLTVVALTHRQWIADARDGLVQAVVSGLAHRASALLTGYVLALVVLAIRQRVHIKRRHSKRDGSPAPTLATTGGPSEEKSTTVVGSDPHSPESITASNH